MKKIYMGIIVALIFLNISAMEVYATPAETLNEEKLTVITEEVIVYNSNKNVFVLDKMYGNILNSEEEILLNSFEINDKEYIKIEDVLNILKKFDLQHDISYMSSVDTKNYSNSNKLNNSSHNNVVNMSVDSIQQETAIVVDKYIVGIVINNKNYVIETISFNNENYYYYEDLAKIFNFGLVHNKNKNSFVFYLGESFLSVYNEEQHKSNVFKAITSSELIDKSYQTDKPVVGDTLAKILTTEGDFTIKLLDRYAPVTVENFITLANENYYDGLLFNNIVEDFYVSINHNDEMSNSIEYVEEYNLGARNYTGAVGVTNNNDFYIIPSYSSEKATYLRNELTEIVSNEQLLNTPIQIDLSLNYVMVKDIISPTVYQNYNKYGGNPNLDFENTVFGQVVEGINVVDMILNSDSEVFINDIIIYEYNEL